MENATKTTGGTRRHVPHLRFDARDHEDRHRFEALNAFAAGVYENRPVDEEDALSRSGFELVLNAWSVGSISAASFTNTRMRATSNRSYFAKDAHALMIRLQMQGQGWVRSGGTTGALTPGRLYALHPDNEIHLEDDTTVMAFWVPYARLGLDPAGFARFASYDTRSGIGIVVTYAIRSFFEALPTMTVQEAEAALPMLEGLFKAMLDHGTPSDIAYAALEHACAPSMRDFVRKHLSDPSLSARRLQAAFGVSRATVYRSFESEGGVVRFILEERLKAAHRKLSASTEQRGLVGRTAEELCFADTATFSRAFQKHFGMRPSEVVGATSTRDDVLTALPDSVGSWIGKVDLATFWNLRPRP